MIGCIIIQSLEGQPSRLGEEPSVARPEALQAFFDLCLRAIRTKFDLIATQESATCSSNDNPPLKMFFMAMMGVLVSYSGGWRPYSNCGSRSGPDMVFSSPFTLLCHLLCQCRRRS